MVACVLVAPMHTRCMASTVNRRIVRMTEKEERELTRFTIWQEPWKVQGQKYRKLTADLCSFLRSNNNDNDDTDNDNDTSTDTEYGNDNDNDTDNEDDNKLHILRGGHHHYYYKI